MNDRQKEDDEAINHPGVEMLDEFGDAPEEWTPAPPFDPDNRQLRAADRDRKIELMREWFLDRYCDPAEGTPYETAEGGYIWIWGGPYNAEDELHARFSGLVGDDVIADLAEELARDGGHEWSPVRRGDERDYEDQFPLDLDLERPDDALSKLKVRLAQATGMLSLQGAPEIVGQLPRMAFGAAISALEAYLWETVAYWTKRDRAVLRNIVTKVPELRDQSLKLGQIFEQHEGIEARVMLYLQNLVWHRWDKVAMLLRDGLGIKPPSFRPFSDALVKRHDIVHRSGHDKEGNMVSVSADDARELAREVETFAESVYRAVLRQLSPGYDSDEAPF